MVNAVLTAAPPAEKPDPVGAPAAEKEGGAWLDEAEGEEEDLREDDEEMEEIECEDEVPNPVWPLPPPPPPFDWPFN